MKLLLLTWNFPPAVGGIEYLVGHLFRGLRARGHEVAAVTSRRDGAAAEEGVVRAARAGLPGFVLFSLTEGRRQMRRFRPDAILCGSLVAAPAGWILSRFFRVPWALIAYGGEIVHPGRIYGAALRFLFRRADLLLPISAHTRDLVARAGIAPRRSAIVHPGVDAPAFDRPPERGAEAILAACEGRRVLLTVGRLVRRKGVLEFVERVMPGIARRCPDALFLVAGEDARASLIHKGEGMRARIEAAIAARGLGSHVRLLGQVPDEDLRRLYFRADVFVLPCLDLPGDVEGFGIVFSEAALARTPIVATRVGGIPDAVEDGVTGFLAPAGDWAKLEDFAVRLLDDAPLRERMSAAAAERARREFDWPVICAKYERELAGLVAGRGA